MSDGYFSAVVLEPTCEVKIVVAKGLDSLARTEMSIIAFHSYSAIRRNRSGLNQLDSNDRYISSNPSRLRLGMPMTTLDRLGRQS